MLNLKWEDPHFDKLQTWFNQTLPDSLTMTHYELAKKSGFSALDWRTFITEPHVSDYINKEFELIKQNKMRQLISQLDSTMRSPGTGQALNALQKLIESGKTKDGPIFIYTYIPLNINEQKAPNVQIAPFDPFLRR
jgi:hypothetical protein